MQDLNDKMTGNSLTAAEWNEMPTELQNIIEAFGIVLSGADLDQVGKGIANYVATGNAYTVGGTANVITLTTIGSKQQPTAYLNGLGVGFVPTANNTGAVTINVNALGAIDLLQEDGTALVADDLISGIALIASFRSGTNDFRILGFSNGVVENAKITQQQFRVAGFGTWTKPAGVKSIILEMVGGGGGGGNSGTTANRGGGGGGSGGYVRETFDVTGVASSAFIVGAGGVSQATGSSTSFTLSTSTALGGIGGQIGTGGRDGGEGGGTSGGTAASLRIKGNGGGSGAGSTATGGYGGAGGAGYFGGGARGRANSGAGYDGLNGGGGGGGAATAAGNLTIGGPGSDGVVLVTEYR